jgi:hypothetical protein
MPPRDVPVSLRRLLPVLGVLLAAVLVLRTCAPLRRALLEPRDRTTITHALVVERVQAVAKLVASEATVRDVVTYEDRWMGSTKRALVVVTGKILTGFDLDSGVTVRVDDATKRIAITLPRARVLAVEITELRTFDEQRGLWNAFTPADRDAIYRTARVQLIKSAADLGSTAVANRSARQLLETMFSVDGYTAEVAIEGLRVESGPAEVPRR